ncbi:MAG: glycosyltransferase [Lentisphaeria bacterium]
MPPPALENMPNDLDLTILMPCLNEAETLPVCIGKALRALECAGLRGEVLVADNGSTDGSQQCAERLGARVVAVAEKGYGNALMGGIVAARGKWVIMGDADDSYDFSALSGFIEELRKGCDLVMGNRFRGGIKPGAMPPLHRYLGNPVLSGIGKLFFHSPCGDFHCGLRGFRKDAILGLDLRTTGMEFASEMVVKATLHRLRISEVPVVLSPDGRHRPPHLRSWRDGWRHLRFLLMYSPRWLFLIPGLFLMALGAIAWLLLLPGPLTVKSVQLDVHSLLFASLALLVGYQAVLLAVSVKIFGIQEGLLPPDKRLDRCFHYVTLESGLVAGTILLLAGLGLSIFAVWRWASVSFGPMSPSQLLRIVIPGSTLLALGTQTLFSSFFLSILGLKRR